MLEASVLFSPPPPSVELFTDVSLEAWEIRDSLSRRLQNFRSYHVDLLKMLTYLVTIMDIFFPENIHIYLHPNDMTTFSCFVRGG